jgi:hypothetical protein
MKIPLLKLLNVGMDKWPPIIVLEEEVIRPMQRGYKKSTYQSPWLLVLVTIAAWYSCQAM